MNRSLLAAALRVESAVEKRLFAEYGSVFATKAISPPVIIFEDHEAVDRFQTSLSLEKGVFGDHEITLQSKAIEALKRAVTEMSKLGGSITARAADSGGRSYGDTVGLWARNVTRGLEHWIDLGRISLERADSIRQLSPKEQVSVILNLEEEEKLFFGTYFDRSILHSVAAPGASQHLSMLAFDVAEYQDSRIDEVMARNGWHRTVINDLPHYTFLGYQEPELSDLGLGRIFRTYGERVYSFWTPAVERLLDSD